MAYGAILGKTVDIPQPVDTVASGNMNAVTSNAVFEALANLSASVQIETGSYVGTGTHGASNPNSLTFSFVPKLLIILPTESSLPGSYSALQGIIFPEMGLGMTIGQTKLLTSVTINNTTLSWYSQESSNSGQYQFNGKIEYDYIAIG